MSNPKFFIRKSKDGQYYFILQAPNGETIATSSETYTRKENAYKGIGSIITNAPVAEIVDQTYKTD
jgi:uncharacterized protein YegP (UPF0339 family)